MYYLNQGVPIVNCSSAWNKRQWNLTQNVMILLHLFSGVIPKGYQFRWTFDIKGNIANIPLVPLY